MPEGNPAIVAVPLIVLPANVAVKVVVGKVAPASPIEL